MVSQPADSLPQSSSSPHQTPTEPHEYQVPYKWILTPEHLTAFQQSSTHSEILAFIDELNDAVKGVKLTDGVEEVKNSEILQAIFKILEEVEQIAKDTPPVPNAASRFGNPAFRDFYDKVSAASESLHRRYLVPLGLPEDSIEEVRVYFNEMWGNRTRIDYGSGMELNWLCWILCLKKLSLLPSSLNPYIPTHMFFNSYIRLMRLLQSTYWLEPAGSHGVWGLDDYHFLPFLWGSGQLVGHRFIRPRAIHDAEVVEECSRDWMYFACVGFVNSIKTASLRWHSPMLDDISAVKTWDKVNAGMKKMYRAEVLGKLPVMQHFLFGSLLPAPFAPLSPSPSPSSPSAAHSRAHAHDHPSHETTSEGSPNGKEKEGGLDGCGHAHAPRNPSGIHPKVLASLQARGEAPPGPHGGEDMGGAGQREVGWGDCCGIPVPSVFAAAQEGEGGQGRGGYALSGVRPVPFD
ncbi:hypothetical protein DFP72DRAFT_1109253 [Ephemerocybe angulata]|uniref:Serine/threonine-protein phosphatase 2A activator n=1 Tax=Ephemerocybe angulata TaxID=980116 RepID=A0A8H6I3F2_9AGAR|nr:hypothetical protein DFP72DRAFT_1109253 [Tulosesus angulatus]